jgi:hypothetical protein
MTSRPVSQLRLWHVFIICIPVCIGFFSILCKAANEYPSLKMHGDIYPNSCSPEQKKMLHGRISKSSLPDAALAWQAVELVLCASSSQINRKEVVALFNRNVTEKTESTADKPIYRKPRRNEELAEVVMAAGGAWNTSILISEKKIVLQYFVNEACVKIATLLHNHSNWSIYEIGQACD